MNLPVLVTEIRRRVYWELRILDEACAEDVGYVSTQGAMNYSDMARMPLNV